MIKSNKKDDIKDNNTIVLSGTIVRVLPNQIHSIGNIIRSVSIPISKEFRLSELFAIENNDASNYSFLKCTCNSFYFFILYKENDKFLINMFKMNKLSNSPVKALESPVSLNIPISANIYQNKISLFCSDNYIFCSLVYNEDKKDIRYIYFSLINQDSQGINLNLIKEKGKKIIDSAFDYSGNNNNFAYFYFKGFKDYENKIYFYSSSNNWKLKKINLIKPSSEVNFYSSKYIKMAFYGNDLYLIGENQKSMRSANSSIKYTANNNNNDSYITNIYTIEYPNPIRIINRKTYTQIHQLKFIPGFKIELEQQEEINDQEFIVSENLTLPIQFKNNSTEWVRSKSSCIFHSCAYLTHIDYTSEPNQNQNDFIDDSWETFKNFGKSD